MSRNVFRLQSWRNQHGPFHESSYENNAKFRQANAGGRIPYHQSMGELARTQNGAMNALLDFGYVCGWNSLDMFDQFFNFSFVKEYIEEYGFEVVVYEIKKNTFYEFKDGQILFNHRTSKKERIIANTKDYIALLDEFNVV